MLMTCRHLLRLTVCYSLLRSTNGWSSNRDLWSRCALRAIPWADRWRGFSPGTHSCASWRPSSLCCLKRCLEARQYMGLFHRTGRWCFDCVIDAIARRQQQFEVFHEWRQSASQREWSWRCPVHCHRAPVDRKVDEESHQWASWKQTFRWV